MSKLGRIRGAIIPMALLATSALHAPAGAESLSERLAKANAVQKVPPVEVACGKLDKSGCSQVLPRIAQHGVALGLSLQPSESEGSVESSTGVCMDLVPVAIVQRDAADQRVRGSDCVGKFDTVGKALYPYYGYLVVSASRTEASLKDMVTAAPTGRQITISAGAVGSGGQVTMAYMLQANPNWKRVVSVSTYGLETALQRIKDNSLDGFFVMDSPSSPLIDTIRTAVDAKGKPIYKFEDVRPGSAFYAIQSWSGRPLFKSTVLEGGYFSNTEVPSTDAVVIVNNAFREDKSRGGPVAVQKLADAIDAAGADIFADTKTPRDWKSTSGR